MIIGVAGRYSAPEEQQKEANLKVLNEAAAKLLEMGHTPVIGLNAALPVVALADIPDEYAAIMDISVAVIDACDALLLLSESPGANRERDWVLSKGLPVYRSLAEVPAAKS